MDLSMFFAFAGIGLLCGGWGIVSLRQFREMAAACSKKVAAEIVDMKPRRHNLGVVYAPVFKFKTSFGEVIKSDSALECRKINEFRVGQKMDVFYNPENPKEFYAEKYDRLKRDGIMFIITGTALILLAIVGLVA